MPVSPNVRLNDKYTPEAGISEWQGEFRADIAAFLSDADIDACVDHDRPTELPPRPDLTYQAFVDPSGGRHDVFALAIGHKDGDNTVIDVLRGRIPPFDPKSVVGEYAALLKEYHVREIVGDNYAAGWVEQAFKDAGLRYVRCERSLVCRRASGVHEAHDVIA